MHSILYVFIYLIYCSLEFKLILLIIILINKIIILYNEIIILYNDIILLYNEIIIRYSDGILLIILEHQLEMIILDTC